LGCPLSVVRFRHRAWTRRDEIARLQRDKCVPAALSEADGPQVHVAKIFSECCRVKSLVMGEMIQLTASDGHQLSAYRADPSESARGGVVVIQEIFGITNHIKAVADEYAANGYLTIAPAMFDRIQKNLLFAYDDVEQARELMLQLDLDKAVDDMAAAADMAREAGNVAVIGYCWGGAMADLAACSGKADAAVAYYGRMIVEWLDSKPACPVMYHFGEIDPLIPPEMVGQIKAARPGGVFHTYAEAGHGFNCKERADYHPASAALALKRTLQFLDEIN
jgi:carboxymethylenebutenolidase